MDVNTFVRSADMDYYRRHPEQVESYRQEVENRLQDSLVDLQLATDRLNRSLQVKSETYEDFLFAAADVESARSEISLQESLVSQTVKALWQTPAINFRITIENFRVAVEAVVSED